MSNDIILRNPKTWDIEQFIDAEKWISKVGDDGEEIPDQGEWVPNTSVPGQEKYDRLRNGEFGEVEIIDPPREPFKKYSEVMARGVKWNGYNLLVDDVDSRERIMSAAMRIQVNNTLPNNKSTFEYPTTDGSFVEIPKSDVQSVAMLIQDYVEQCTDNYRKIKEDPTLDINSGWPS